MRFGFGSRLALAGMIAALAQGAGAATINVQFGETSSIFGPTPHYTGSAVVGDANDLWNFAGGTFNPGYLTSDPSGWGRTVSGLSLLDVDGNATGASLSLTTPDAFISLEPFAPIFKNTPYAALMDSFVFADDDRLGQAGGDGPGAITISGLKAGQSYELILLSAGDVLGRATRFSLGGLDKLATPSGATSFIDGDNYVSFLTSADAGGSLSFSFDAGNGIEGDLNGFQLVERHLVSIDEPTAAPEPATWALFILGFGLVGATARTRRSGSYRLQGSRAPFMASSTENAV